MVHGLIAGTAGAAGRTRQMDGYGEVVVGAWAGLRDQVGVGEHDLAIRAHVLGRRAGQRGVERVAQVPHDVGGLARVIVSESKMTCRSANARHLDCSWGSEPFHSPMVNRSWA